MVSDGTKRKLNRLLQTREHIYTFLGENRACSSWDAVLYRAIKGEIPKRHRWCVVEIEPLHAAVSQSRASQVATTKCLVSWRYFSQMPRPAHERRHKGVHSILSVGSRPLHRAPPLETHVRFQWRRAVREIWNPGYSILDWDVRGRGAMVMITVKTHHKLCWRMFSLSGRILYLEQVLQPKNLCAMCVSGCGKNWHVPGKCRNKNETSGWLVQTRGFYV